MRVSVGDVALYVHERGEGRPLVALHGGPGLDGSVWFPGLDPLVERGYRVPTSAQELTALVPNCEEVVIPDGAHMLPRH